jgi:hypothetical protein
VYEGYTLNDKPCGEGTSYYPNGKIFQEGIFDIKGLIKGAEYYPNGNIRNTAGKYEDCMIFPTYQAASQMYSVHPGRNQIGFLFWKQEK